MSTDHSQYSPSTAKRWMACPGSIGLSATVSPLPESTHAREGTQAHAVAEAILLNKTIPDFADSDMIEYGKQYRGFIYDKLIESGASILGLNVEARVHLKESKEVYGTVDCWFYSEKNDTLYVIDYKYGRGVLVDAIQNEQMMIYALAIISNNRFTMADCRVELNIVQPRLNNFSTWLTTANFLRNNFEPQMNEAVFVSKQPDAFFQDGGHCRWCPAEAICPKKREALNIMFEVNVEGPIQPRKQPTKLTGEQIATYINRGEYLNSWLSALRAHAKSMIEHGEEVPGYTIECKQGNRAWLSATDAETAFKSKYGAAIYELPKMKSPAQMEKVATKDEVSKFTFRPEGMPQLIKLENSKSDKFIPFNEGLWEKDEL